MPPLGTSTVSVTASNVVQCHSLSSCCLSTLLHRLVVGPLSTVHPSKDGWTVLIGHPLDLFRFDSTGVHFWSVYWLSSITSAQAILIASVCSVEHWYPLSDRVICDAVFIRNLYNFSESAIFTGIKPIFHVFRENSWLTSACEYWDNTLSFKSRLTSCCLKIHLQS